MKASTLARRINQGEFPDHHAFHKVRRDLLWARVPKEDYDPPLEDLYPGIREDMFSRFKLAASPASHQWFEYCHELTKGW